MHYLLVDRGSKGGVSSKKRIKEKLKLDPEYQGTRYLSMGRSRQYGSAQKWQDEYLAPLRRYLKKQVGRPWNEVYSEIRATVKPDSTVRYHIYQHMEWEVAKHVEYIEGQPYFKPCNRNRLFPVTGLYICPDSGLLKYIPPPPRKQKSKAKRSPITKLPITRDRWYELIDGQWYEISIHRWSEKVPNTVRQKNGQLNTELEEKEFTSVHKKQLSKKELKLIRNRLSYKS